MPVRRSAVWNGFSPKRAETAAVYLLRYAIRPPEPLASRLAAYRVAGSPCHPGPNRSQTLSWRFLPGLLEPILAVAGTTDCHGPSTTGPAAATLVFAAAGSQGEKGKRGFDNQNRRQV